MSPLLFVLLAVAPVAPPPIVTVPVAPPAPSFYAPRPIGGPPAMPATDFDIEVRAGGEILWSGSMRVAGNYPASFSRQKTDAPPGDCTAGSFGYGGGERSALTINLSAYRTDATDGRFQLQLNWERPGTGGNCGGGRNVRTVGIAESFDLQPGQSGMVAGDGGLVARIRRR